MSPELHGHAHGWSFPLLVPSALVLIALVYLRGWFRLRNDFPNTIPARRIAAFMSGLLFLWIVVGSPLCALDHDSLTVHMINHLMLMMMVAPLILFGVPDRILLRGLPELVARNAHILITGNRRAQSVGRFVTNPFFCWLFATATVIGWHIPAVFRLAQRSHSWHSLEYTSFLLAGLLFWLPVVRSATGAPTRPGWSLPMYLFLATLPCDILSAFLVFCGRVLYSTSLSERQLFNFSPLQDQQCAGALMWVCVTFAYLLPAFVITVQILSPAGLGPQQPTRLSHRLAPRPMNDSHAEVE